MNAVLTAIRGERAFRAAFRGAGGAAAGLVDNVANNAIIDQFNHNNITGAEAGAAFNNG